MNYVLLLGAILSALVLIYNVSIFIIILYGKRSNQLIQKEERKGTLSIIIPAKDEEEVIGSTLRHIDESNTDGLKEIVVVDDGSTDSTGRIAQSFDTKVLRTQGVGKVGALNKGLTETTGDIVFVIDADTKISSGVLQEARTYFQDPTVGAISPPIYTEGSTVLSWFQRVEYEMNDAVRRGLSALFGSDIWFFGAVSAYRGDWIRNRGFQSSTVTEDSEIAVDIRKAGYKVLRLEKSYCVTKPCYTIREFISQRIRWFQGGYQLLLQRGKELFTISGGKFITVTHWFWGLYSALFLPLLVYQLHYWLPSSNILAYIFRWFTILGPIQVLRNIPEGWLSIYNVFGVTTGLFMVPLLVTCISFRRRLQIEDIVVLLFYFPYTIYLNAAFTISIIKAMFQRKGTFKR